MLPAHCRISALLIKGICPHIPFRRIKLEYLCTRKMLFYQLHQFESVTFAEFFFVHKYSAHIEAVPFIF